MARKRYNYLLMTPNQFGSTLLFFGIVCNFVLSADLKNEPPFSNNDGSVLPWVYAITTIIVAFYLFVTAWLPEASTKFTKFARNANNNLRKKDLYLRVTTYLILNLLFIVANPILSDFTLFPKIFILLSLLCLWWDYIMYKDYYFKTYASKFLRHDIMYFISSVVFVLYILLIKKKASIIDNVLVYFIYAAFLLLNLGILLCKDKGAFAKSFGLLLKSLHFKPQREI